MELLLVLPDGSKSLVPAAWTDAKPSGADGEGVVATLGSLSDLLHLSGCHRPVAARTARQGQAAGMSPCKEDSRAACPAQFDTRPAPERNDRPVPAPPAPTVEQLPADAADAAIMLLATVIAKAAAPMRSEVAGDE